MAWMRMTEREKTSRTSSTPEAGRNRCDSCSSPVPAWRYPALAFADLIGARSLEDWLACEEGHSLIIEAGDRMGLGLRSGGHGGDHRTASQPESERADQVRNKSARFGSPVSGRRPIGCAPSRFSISSICSGKLSYRR